MSSKNLAGSALTIFGLLAGAAVGGAIALVNSPSDGKENRKHLNQWAHKRLDDAQHRIEKGK